MLIEIVFRIVLYNALARLSAIFNNVWVIPDKINQQNQSLNKI